MARYMLDTNICIYLMKHQPPEVGERFAQCYVGDVVISSITLAELEYGVVCSGSHRRRNRAALDAFLQEVPAMPFDSFHAGIIIETVGGFFSGNSFDGSFLARISPKT
jgi:tRNA(fMet)-specific endonuclease VapC